MILQQIYILFDHTSGLIHHWSITLIFKDMFIYDNFVAQIPWNHWKWSYFQPAFIALSNFALFQIEDKNEVFVMGRFILFRKWI